MANDDAPTDLEHPAWCQRTRCTAHLDQTPDNVRGGNHWSAPHHVYPGAGLHNGYPFVEVSLWTCGHEPPDAPAAAELLLTRRDHFASTESYDLVPEQMRELAEVLLNLAAIGTTGHWIDDGSPMSRVTTPDEQIRILTANARRVSDLHEQLERQLADPDVDHRAVAEQTLADLTDLVVGPLD